MKKITVIILLALLTTSFQSAQGQAASDMSQTISGQHLKPYSNKWKLYSVDGQGKETLVTIWTDYAQLIELDRKTYVSRIQELYNPSMQLQELWTNLFEHQTMLPYRASQFKTTGDYTYTEFGMDKVVHSTKTATEAAVNTDYRGDGKTYDWTMYGVLLSGLPFKKGEAYSIPVFSQQAETGKGTIVATIAGKETVTDDNKKQHSTWKVETNAGLTFWLTKKAPYVIQLSYPTQNGGKMLWRMYD